MSVAHIVNAVSMSRTPHHRNQKNAHIGEDFWSKRARMGHYGYSTFGKRLTISKERMEERELLVKEINLLGAEKALDTQ